MFKISLDFLEDRNKTFKFDRKSLSLMRGKDYVGDLARIQKEFMVIGSAGNPAKDKIVTSSPVSLLHQVKLLFKWAIPSLFFFIFAFLTELTVNKCSIKVCP